MKSFHYHALPCMYPILFHTSKAPRPYTTGLNDVSSCGRLSLTPPREGETTGRTHNQFGNGESHLSPHPTSRTTTTATVTTTTTTTVTTTTTSTPSTPSSPPVRVYAVKARTLQLSITSKTLRLHHACITFPVTRRRPSFLIAITGHRVTPTRGYANGAVECFFSFNYLYFVAAYLPQGRRMHPSFPPPHTHLSKYCGKEARKRGMIYCSLLKCGWKRIETLQKAEATSRRSDRKDLDVKS